MLVDFVPCLALHFGIFCELRACPESKRFGLGSVRTPTESGAILKPVGAFSLSLKRRGRAGERILTRYCKHTSPWPAVARYFCKIKKIWQCKCLCDHGGQFSTPHSSSLTFRSDTRASRRVLCLVRLPFVFRILPPLPYPVDSSYLLIISLPLPETSFPACLSPP